MPKIKKYFVYFISFFSFIVLMGGGLFTAIQINVQRQNNKFFDQIEKINLLIKKDEVNLAKQELLCINRETKNSDKKALTALILKKIGEPLTKEILEDYTSKCENYEKFNLVKECLLRLFFLEEKSYSAMQDFRWKHSMQRIHLLTTLRADLLYKDILSKQLFDFYLHNLVYMNINPELDNLFFIMAAS